MRRLETARPEARPPTVDRKDRSRNFPLILQIPPNCGSDNAPLPDIDQPAGDGFDAAAVFKLGETVSEKNPNAIGSSLDDLFGVWSRDEAESFDSALEVFETVDESAWA